MASLLNLNAFEAIGTMFHTLTDVQRGEAVPLQRYIDNRDGRLYIGLMSITFAVGWYNIEQGGMFSWRQEGAEESYMRGIPPGLYSFDQLKEILERVTFPFWLEEDAYGFATLSFASGWEVRLSDSLLTPLGLDGYSGVWLKSGPTYRGARPVNFAKRQMLWVHLEEVNTTENLVNGAPSTLLASIGVERHAFGDVKTVRMECPEYKRLRDGTVGELKVTVRDEYGKALSNHDLPIHVTLAVIKK